MKIGDIASGLSKLASLLSDFDGRKGAGELAKFAELLMAYEGLTVSGFAAHIAKLETQPTPPPPKARVDQTKIEGWIKQLEVFDPVNESIEALISRIEKDTNAQEAKEIAQQLTKRVARGKAAAINLISSHFTTLRSSRQRAASI